jgi:tRNA (guanine26-N2/guanine27-N2)-dimethyltransferase
MNTDLNLYCGNRRFDYIDVDPFGSPVPFLQTSLRSLKKNGILAVTATDTAALTGSVPRVARRRYGVNISRTHFMQEMGCRVLMGYLARLSATFEISVEPLLFYSSDHFLRGYVKIEKGAKKADRCLDSLNWFIYKTPHPPRILEKPWDDGPKKDYKVMGPVWTGPLADAGFCRSSLSTLERLGSDQIRKYGSIEKMLSFAIWEERFPPGGFDVNETASHLGASPPSMQKISGAIEEHGYDWSRSRFSPTIVKTDAGEEIFEVPFRKGGEM